MVPYDLVVAYALGLVTLPLLLAGLVAWGAHTIRRADRLAMIDRRTR